MTDAVVVVGGKLVQTRSLRRMTTRKRNISQLLFARPLSLFPVACESIVVPTAHSVRTVHTR